ncbi:MAG: hypothetical protein ACM359_03540 [Bacillota bacterium]
MYANDAANTDDGARDTLYGAGGTDFAWGQYGGLTTDYFTDVEYINN